MSRGIDVSSARFPLLLETIPIARSKSATEAKLLYVFNSGEVFTTSVKRACSDYLFSTRGNVRNHQPEIVSQNHLRGTRKIDACMDEIVAHASFSQAECKLRFRPIPNFQQAHAELVKNRLLIFGMLHDGVPSFGIFTLICDDGDVKFRLAYTDSILAVADVALTDSHYLVIPRLVGGSIVVIEAPSEPSDYRMIPSISILGHNCPAMSHVTSSPRPTDWTWAAWSDDRTPTLSVWKSTDTDTTWKCAFYEFTEPAWIRTVLFSPTGTKLGVVVMIRGKTLACLWQLDREGRITQDNYVCNNVGELLAVRWQPAAKDSAEALVVIGTTGMVEVSKGSGVRFWPQSERPAVLFEDVSPLARFYVNTAGQLKVTNIADLSDKMTPKAVPDQKHENVTLVRIRVDGEKKIITGMHMHRCGNCAAPLLCPLLSSSEDGKLRQFYCSRKCQMEHWPMYELTMSDEVFKIEEP